MKKIRWDIKTAENGETLYYCMRGDELLFFTDDKRVLDYHWCKYGNGYAITRDNGEHIIAHRLVSNPEDWEIVDHINRNKKDNRSCNLRNTTPSINALNIDAKSSSKCGVNGVHFRKDTEKWEARITHDRETISLGCYDTLKEAVIARRAAEQVVFHNQTSRKGVIL